MYAPNLPVMVGHPFLTHKSKPMILSFSKQNIEQRCFAEKIWQSLMINEPSHEPTEECKAYVNAHCLRFGKAWNGHMTILTPKIHTIRADTKNRWRKGRNIHFAMNCRQPTYFQFAPVIPCVSTQQILITKESGTFEVFIDELPCKLEDIIELSYNDGFDSVKEMFDYFGQYERFEGKIIHWTNKVYHKTRLEYIEQQKSIDNPLKVVE